MATVQAQKVIAAAVHESNGVKEEENQNHEMVQEDTLCAELEQAPDHAKVRSNGDSRDEEAKAADEEVPAAIVDTVDKGHGMAQEVEALAKLALQHHQGLAEAEATAKEPTEERRSRGAKKTEKAAAKGAVVPVDDETDDDEVDTPAEQAPVASDEEAATKGDQVQHDDKEYAGDLQKKGDEEEYVGDN